MAGVVALDDVLGGLGDVPVEYLAATDKATLLRRLASLEARVTALRVRVLAVADDVADAAAAREPADWYAAQTRHDRSRARRDQRLGEALLRREHLAASLAGGSINADQAMAIAQALDDLPGDLPEGIPVRAEIHLIELADLFTPRQLRILGRKILEVVAPEIAEAHEARLLEAEERRADALTRLEMRPYGDGTTRVLARVPDAIAHRLATCLDAFTSPRHGSGDEIAADRRPHPVRQGHALCALLERIDPERLPRHGGDATTVIITMGLDELRTDLAAAGILGNGPISAAEARRLACNAKLVPAVLGSESEVLDLGRGSRLFTPAQRRALRLRDQRCRVEGCTVPAAWCEAHHHDPWSRGGGTDLDNGVLLCWFHHRRAHDRGFRHDRLPNGDVRFCRRT